MQYRTMGRTGVSVSALGFGCMRFPKTESGAIDRPRAVAMIRSAIDAGVNYLDTAYVYHDGTSEGLLAEALADGYRDRVFLADKLPTWMVHAPEDFDRLLDEQLNRLHTDHIDFYLLHALSRDRWRDIVLRFGLPDKLRAARAAGKIRHIGFSFHDTNDAFHEILDGFDEWDFCQIQYNYINTDAQAGQEGLAAAAKRGLGVVIMEPLLGGRLANPPARVASCLPEGVPPVQAALDFLWTQKEVAVVLSGMSDETQVAQNLAFADASRVGKVPAADFAAYGRAKAVFDHMALVGCTGCAYCMPCPFGVQIPAVFAAYNRTVADGMKAARAAYDALDGAADRCRACRRCEQVCPQHLPIASLMTQVREKFAPQDASAT